MITVEKPNFAGADVVAVNYREPSNRIHQLDGLRGLLALFVVSFHLMGPFEIIRSASVMWAPLLLQAWYAVDVFFLMSGFVMMHVYGAEFAGGCTWPKFLNFMRARCVRLYPVHIFAMCLMLIGLLPVLVKNHQVFFSIDGRYSLGAFLESLLMLHGPWVNYRSWNYPAWSISAEWHAYLLFPLFCIIIKQLSLRLTVAITLLGGLVPFYLYTLQLIPDQYPTNGLMVFGRVIPLFFVGMTIYTAKKKIGKFSNTFSLLIVVSTIFCLSSPDLSPFAVLIAPLLVLAVLENAVLINIFSSKPLLWLGKISYSLYMTHALIEGFLIKRIILGSQRIFGIDLESNLYIAIALWIVGIILSIIFGWVTWRWVELRAREYLLVLTKTKKYF